MKNEEKSRLICEPESHWHKKVIVGLAIIILALVWFILSSRPSMAPAAEAHQPILLKEQTEVVEIEKPEISKGYYGELLGSPQYFHIKSEIDFKFYVNILIPFSDQAKTDFTVEVKEGERLITKLDGKSSVWKEFFEEFTGDTYLMGPEYNADLKAGDYSIIVSSGDFTGKYILAVGEEEKFGPLEGIKSSLVLPEIKEKYFGKNFQSILTTKAGIYYIVPVIVFILIVLIAVIVLVKKIKGSSDTID